MREAGTLTWILICRSGKREEDGASDQRAQRMGDVGATALRVCHSMSGMPL